MGAGIAVDFRERFPLMFEEYKRRCASGTFSLGSVFLWEEPGHPAIFNLGTQRSWKSGAEMPAIETAVVRMVQLAQQKGHTRIGLPRIGAGLGRLPWEPIRDLLARTGDATAVELVVFETYRPAA
jgi:O-acetyl-ADP-ribose deacetylase (regulator of RNase III)